MNDKDSIREAPWKVFITTKHYYWVTESKLSIVIEIINEIKKLVLFSGGMHRGRRGTRYLRYNRYDDNGNDYFNRLMNKFGKITVKIQSGDKYEFDNYDKFLETITSENLDRK